MTRSWGAPIKTPPIQVQLTRESILTEHGHAMLKKLPNQQLGIAIYSIATVQ
jgi:hypothetical protein